MIPNHPPTLPVPRHPSPLSLGMGDTLGVEMIGHPTNRRSQSMYSNTSSPVPSVFESEELGSGLGMEESLTYTNTQMNGRRTPSSSGRNDQTTPSEAGPSFKVPLPQSRVSRSIPIRPSPDSIVHRTTLKQLESQTVTLKRLTKTVLANLAIVSGIYEQLEKAEDELLGSLGELATWLGHGYGLKDGVWDAEAGVRGIKKEKRRREREDLEVMVQHGVDNVRVELKRRGLAGGGATARYEKHQQGYYHQTGAYLAPGSSSMTPSQSTSHLQSSSSSSSHTADRAQMAKTAQMDLMSYQHHSALLYAVPPSSLICLDLLVSLHSWAGSLLPETTVNEVRRKSSSDSTPRRLPEGLGTPVRILSRPDRPINNMKTILGESLAQMAGIRSDLLNCWGLRNAQQHLLENEVQRKQAEADGTWNVNVTEASPTIPQSASGWTGPVSSAGIESRKPERKMHKIHRSVGGKLRDLLSSSNSSHSLAHAMGDKDRGSRTSFDYGQPIIKGIPRPRTESVPEHSIIESTSSPVMTPFPTTTPSTSRPILATRHSVQLERGDTYVSPINYLASPDPNLDLSLGLGLGDRTEIFAGVGGFSGTGDEDEIRGQVGRKNEGVLWTPGTWEGLGRSNSKAKWEMAWVVLDHSKIYEYGGIDTTQFECQAAIDLRFASVREGRDIDRRFVFEVISAKEGRRLYQATSESDMKMWLYAIANAIESCINGTSSVRTFDASRLRTQSGALDDYALPARQSSKLGMGFPLPPIPSTPGNRRSMPPLGRNSSMGDKERRVRKTSFKNVLKQSGEKWQSVMSGVTNRNSASFDIPRPTFGAIEKDRDMPVVNIPGSDGRVTPTNTNSSTPGIEINASPSKSVLESWGYDTSDSTQDTVIEKRVLEMAGLGLGDSPRSASLARRVQSEGVSRHLVVNPGNSDQEGSGTEMARSRSAETANARRRPEMTMKVLRELADNPQNSKCADCKKPTKASQWATLNLRGVPMVMFLCIRCCGLHRGLGTHISKPRGINLDHWSPDSIALAYEWGNERGNGIWERCKPETVVPTDDNISGYIQAKYVEGRWLTPEDRAKFTWAVKDGVGRAF